MIIKFFHQGNAVGGTGIEPPEQKNKCHVVEVQQYTVERKYFASEAELDDCLKERSEWGVPFGLHRNAFPQKAFVVLPVEPPSKPIIVNTAIIYVENDAGKTIDKLVA